MPVIHVGKAQISMANSWNGPASGSWFAAANWAAGLPQDKTYEVPDISGTYTVNYDKADNTDYSNGVVVEHGATLNVTASSTSVSPVFKVNGITIGTDSTVNVTTTSPVTLGSSNATVNGTLRIVNNNSVDFGYKISGSGSIILDGSTVGLSQAVALDKETVTLVNGSKIYLNDTGSAKFAFGAANAHAAANQLIVPDNGGNPITNEITGYNSSSLITVAAGSTAPINATFSANGNGTYKLYIALNAYNYGITFTDISFAAGVTPSSAKIVQNDDGSWSVVTATTHVCFLAGTRILTISGEKSVETLTEDDVLVTLGRDGAPSEQRVVWIGRQHARVQPWLAITDAGYPVRISANAIAEGLPSRDLLVTAEHCLFIDGGFVPARMLVNGRSISYDLSRTSFDYFHVETEHHAIILADSMPTESYLDTGNRAQFEGNDIGKLVRTWHDDAAAPLTTAREIVEPIFDRINRRAETLGFAPAIVDTTATNGTNLHVVLPDGRSLAAVRHVGNQFVFSIPATVGMVRLVSNAARPSDAIGPYVDDRRTLGLLVSGVTLWDADSTRSIDFRSGSLAGWNPVEGEMRWTSGDALIELGDRAPGVMGMLVIDVAATAPRHEGKASIAA